MLAPVLYGDPVLRPFKCEDEGAYLAYVTEIRVTQKGRKARPSLRLVVEISGLVRTSNARTEQRNGKINAPSANMLAFRPTQPNGGEMSVTRNGTCGKYFPVSVSVDLSTVRRIFAAGAPRPKSAATQKSKQNRHLLTVQTQ